MKTATMILGLILFGILRSQTEEALHKNVSVHKTIEIPHIYADATPALQEMKTDENLSLSFANSKHRSLYSSEIKPTPRKTENQNKMKTYPKI